MALGFLAVAGPWLAYVSFTGGLLTFIGEMFNITGSKVMGMSLPHPLLVWTDLVVSVLYFCAYALPACLIVAMVGARMNGEPILRESWVAAVAAIAFLPQSMHRSDASHLLRVAPTCLMAAAAAFQMRTGLLGDGVHRGLIGTVTCLLAAMTLASTASRLPSPAALSAERWREYSEPFAVVATSRKQRAFTPRESAAVSLLVRCSAPADHVAVYPFAPKLAYAAQRVFGGRDLALVPGYFDDARSQNQSIEALKRERVYLILWDEAFVFDGRRERRPVSTHTRLHDFMTATYTKAGSAGSFAVYRLRGTPPARAGGADGKDC